MEVVSRAPSDSTRRRGRPTFACSYTESTALQVVTSWRNSEYEEQPDAHAVLFKKLQHVDAASLIIYLYFNKKTIAWGLSLRGALS